MALVLEIHRGRGFYVKDTKVTVEQIFTPSRFQVMVHSKSGLSTLMEVNNKQKTEILPDVYVQAGRDQNNRGGDLCKIAITAPPNVKILRDTLYEKANVKAS